MDIAGLSMGIAQTRLLNDVGIAVLSKSLKNAENVGAAFAELLDSAAMERSVNPEIGGNIDISV